MFNYSGLGLYHFDEFCSYLESNFGLIFPKYFRVKGGSIKEDITMDSSDLGVLGYLFGGKVDVSFEYYENGDVVYASLEFSFNSRFVKAPTLFFYFDYDESTGWSQEII